MKNLTILILLLKTNIFLRKEILMGLENGIWVERLLMLWVIKELVG